MSNFAAGVASLQPMACLSGVDNMTKLYKHPFGVDIG